MIKLKGFYDRNLQKFLAVIFLFCLLFSCGTVTARAQSPTRITASSCKAERGDNLSVSFNLEGNPGIWGLKLRIHYDHSVMTLKSVSTGSVFEKSEFIMSENLNKDPFVVIASGNALENKTADGTIVALNFTLSSNAAFKAYPVTVEVVQVNNVDGDEIVVDAENGSIAVVECKHSDKGWHIAAAAECEKTGTETLTCKKCGEIFETRAIKAAGHRHTELRNAAAATKTANGYTGDTYCKDCGKLIGKGRTISKLNDGKPAVNLPDSSVPSTEKEPEIISGSDSVFTKDSKKSLVFVSSADYANFLRVELDGTVLDSKDYAVEEDHTTVTISADCLNRLNGGNHTVSIISKTGTATAQFTVKIETEISDIPVNDSPSSENTETETKSSAVPVIITIVIVVLLAGGAVIFFVIKRKRG